ncbi:Polyketide cyclase / dehydrase and lipid transport [Micromonospora pattaloongensis]|uniref:Polyketide cyclase / dehydrase and lipid transport n=1 Tax=Micromonospora pattaloongensis TaxID=405436 RepID=A0A1H3Q949_9ACTN|nr:SRPBCC family protein [Micromonospora pattaloongensis]SDZ10072.1 Polyketide cyclase / dehydrase and lipid transport [Micromonospora pattaloongensis]
MATYGRLTAELRNLADAAGARLTSTAAERIGAATERLSAYAERGGGPGLVAAATGARRLAEGKSPARAVLGAGLAGAREKLKQAFGAGGAKNKIKVTNIVETVDVGAPVRLVYDQWTQVSDFPRFMKKVEHAERESDRKLTWKAQVLWSHREWESTVVEQVPDERIIWRSTGRKGSVDGAVSFHELAPGLTRIVVVLEYHPQGLFERTGNLWRAPGRRARLELKHFVRHVMTETVRHPEGVTGWRGEIRDGRVVRDHDAAMADEQHDTARAGADPDGAVPGEQRRAPRGRSGRPERRPRRGDEQPRGRGGERHDDEQPRRPGGERPRRTGPAGRARDTERSEQ